MGDHFAELDLVIRENTFRIDGTVHTTQIPSEYDMVYDIMTYGYVSKRHAFGMTD